MTVAELIEALRAMPQDAVVTVFDRNDGYEMAEGVECAHDVTDVWCGRKRETLAVAVVIE